MSKLIRLSPTGIEYGDYTWNFVSGCGNNIDGKCKDGGFNCRAYSITQRFKCHYPSGFKPTIYPDALLSPLYLKKPSRILCAFMGDLFGDWFNPDEKIEAILPSGVGSIGMSLKGWIYTTIEQCSQHTFIFLTKQPQNLVKFSPFPDNCWVGVTVTGNAYLSGAIERLRFIEAKIRFVSFEPLLSEISGYHSYDLAYLLEDSGIKWVIIGAQTKPTVYPKIEWVEEIVRACDKVGVRVFLKYNLMPLILKEDTLPIWAMKNWVRGKTFELRQELPEYDIEGG